MTDEEPRLYPAWRQAEKDLLAAGFTYGSLLTKEWLDRENIPLLASDFLGPWSRKVLFLPNSGDVFCRRMVTNMATAETIAREEQSYAATLAQKPKTTDKKIELF